jgi:hypothetical protein
MLINTKDAVGNVMKIKPEVVLCFLFFFKKRNIL